MGLYPLMPDKVRVDRDQRNRLVLHIPGLRYDGLVGYSPIALAKNAISISIACEDYGASFFGNNANPSGVLEHPG